MFHVQGSIQLAVLPFVCLLVELEESGIKEDKKQSEEQTYTEVRVRVEDVTV